MYILTGDSITRKSEFGDFELKAVQGWKISDSFIDFESGLLIVSTSNEDKNTWEDSGFGSRTIPTRQYIIDKNEKRILAPEEWCRKFSYEVQELLSSDRTRKLIFQRIHEAAKNTDSIKEELIDLGTGNVLSRSNSVAFRREKRENLLEYEQRCLQEKQQRIEKEEAKLTLDRFYEQELSRLKEGVVFWFQSSKEKFQLFYNGLNFELGTESEHVEQAAWYRNPFTTIRRFDTLDEFWQTFTEHVNWYIVYTPLVRNKDQNDQRWLLTGFIIKAFNEIRKQQQFTPEEYGCLHRWENLVYTDQIRPTEYKQYCSHCWQEVAYSPRYPTYVCSSCRKNLKDRNGRAVEFYNTGISGGCQGYYIDVTPHTKYNSYQCFIEGKLYYASEARFGGIVIQKSGWNED